MSDQLPDPDWRALKIEGPANPGPGRLIVIEGVDGVGKSTVLETVAGEFAARGQPILQTRTPTMDLRAYPAWRAWFDETPSLPRERIDGFGLSIMALGDRLIHQRATIEPALAAGTCVLCDRYVLSSLVYECSDIHRQILSRLVAPDIRILLSASPRVVLERLAARTYEAMHPADADEKPLLITRYQELAQLNGYRVISTDCELSETLSAVRAVLSPLFKGP